MGRNNRPQKVCPLCTGVIRKDRDNSLKCPHCETTVHKNCATRHKLIKTDGNFYCQVHDVRAPKMAKRNRVNTENEATPVADVTGDENAVHNKDDNNQQDNGDNPLCQECGTGPTKEKELVDCAVCHGNFHFSCVDDVIYQNQINGDWTCSLCLIKWAQKVANYQFPGSSENIKYGQAGSSKSRHDSPPIDTRDIPSLESVELEQIVNNSKQQQENYMSLIGKSIYLDRQDYLPTNHLAHSTLNLNSENKKIHSISSGNGNHHSQLSQVDKNRKSSNMSTHQDKNIVSSNKNFTNQVQKFFEGTKNNAIYGARNPIIANYWTRNDPPVPQGRNVNELGCFPSNSRNFQDPARISNQQRQSENNRRHSDNQLNDNNRGNIDNDQRKFEESLLRFQRIDDVYREAMESNKRIAEVQLYDSRKNTYRKLPVVTSKGYAWKLFYAEFLGTKEMFTPLENVLRIQDAIQCEEIKKLGGINLFNSETFEIALSDIDKRIGSPDKLLIEEKMKLVEKEKLRDFETSSIIKFIDEVRQYACLVDKVGCLTDKVDSALIARLTRLLPDKLKNGWTRQYAKMKHARLDITISDMSVYLTDQIESYEASLWFEKLDPYGEIKTKPPKNLKRNDTKPKHLNTKFERLNMYDSSSESENEESSNVEEENFNATSSLGKDSPASYCWYHNKEGHSSYSCYGLMKKSGQEVTKIARKMKICVTCGRKEHGKCEYANKLMCIIPTCNMFHATVFCFKRKYIEKSKDSNEKKKTENEFNQTETVEQKILSNHEENDTNNVVDAYDLLYGSYNVNCVSQWNTNVVEEKLSEQINVQVTSQHGTSSTLMSVVVFILKNGNKKVEGAFLLDSGSTSSLIDEEIANYLQCEGPTKPITLAWSGGQTRKDDSSRIIKAIAKGKQENAKEIEICFRTIRNLSMSKQSFNVEEMKKKFPHLRKLELSSYKGIAGIIGNDQHGFFKQLKWLEGKNLQDDSPVAILTPLGYYVIGSQCPLPVLYKHLTEISNNAISYHHSVNKLSDSEEEELIKMQERVMGLEYNFPSENDRKLVDEEKAMEILHEKTRKNLDTLHYEAPLLWKDDVVKLPTEESLKIAIRRLKILISHALRIGKFDDIKCQIDNLLDKGYARQLTRSEILNPPPKAFYVPIFISNQKEKRLRLIWDAACKVNGKSLNDYLLPGPNLYNNLINMLTQMREGKYFVKGDISEMFHQVGIIKDDRSALRFLSVNEPNGPIQHYEMNVMIFGAICSPTTSQFVKNKIAQEYQEKFPDASLAIQRNTYVDDFVKSFDNLEQGKLLVKDARKILNTGGFNLVKLQSNHSEILEYVKNDLTEADKNNPKLFTNEEMEKILGYNINFENDTISLAFNFQKIRKLILQDSAIPNKKQILQLLMSIFDPIGFFMFLTSKLKLIYHWVCKEKLDWKDPINNNHFNQWIKCLKWLEEIPLICIPRSYVKAPEQFCIWQLIICGDAGKEILCAVAYLRRINEKREQIDYSFMFSKSYIVPIKQNRSIPELELDIASKSVKLAKLLHDCHLRKFDETYFITDSACVYSWINNGAKKPTIYVRNRLKKIESYSEKKSWMWIPTNLQPADYGTKFDSMPKNCYENDWYHPKFFSLPEGSWFKLKPPLSDIETQLNSHIQIKPLKIEENLLINFDSFNCWEKYIKMAQCIIKFIYIKCKKQELLNNSESLRRKAELWLIKEAQRISMAQIIRKVEKGMLEKNNKLYKLTPFIDKDGVLRITTRLPLNEKFTLDKARPIILPKDHRITELIILKMHKNNHHSHYKTVVINLLQKFYIPSINHVVKKIIKDHCYLCKRFNARPIQPMMGNLPSYKLALNQPPFSCIAVDVCGPFDVKIKRNTEKRWLMVFSCLTTRALHIEIIYRMNTQDCLMALQNLINLRGAPKIIVSDNGTNFLGGSNTLKTTQNQWNDQLLMKGIIMSPIIWEFNPAKASHMNGSVERMIGLIKSVLYKMSESLNKKMVLPSEAIFRCIICEIIGLLNNRPLTMLNIEGEENIFLTPNHFIIQRENFQSAPNNINYSRNIINEWEHVKEFMQILWNHFYKAYINEIIFRQKWFKMQKPLEIGDLVVTADPTVVSLWRLGKITQISPGSNNQVRKVTIKLGKRNFINNSSDKKIIMKEYSNEKFSEITRPASQVAAINLLS